MSADALGDVRIRDESAADAAAVFEVQADAFPTNAEAKLVERLRGVANPLISLVAETAGVVVGHVLFTPVNIDVPSGRIAGMGLAPVAVRKAHQGRGGGGALIRAGLARCREDGHGAVVVLGHRDYYPRFGFRPAWDRGLYYGVAQPNPSFMLIEFEPGALPAGCGAVHYHPAFDAL